MFIKKWRYEMQLQCAKEEGKREGYRDAVEKHHEMLLDLEKENLKFREELASARKNCENFTHVVRELRIDAAENFKRLVDVLATELAAIQTRVDVEFYINHNMDACNRYIVMADMAKTRAMELGICAEVYERAYEIYDFRNSGKEGYTLADGKIVPVEEAPQEDHDALQETATKEETDIQEDEPTDPDEYLIREACTAEEQEAACQEEVPCPFEECPY